MILMHFECFFYDFEWFSLIVNDVQWYSMCFVGFHGCSTIVIDFRWLSLSSVDFNRIQWFALIICLFYMYIHIYIYIYMWMHMFFHAKEDCGSAFYRRILYLLSRTASPEIWKMKETERFWDYNLYIYICVYIYIYIYIYIYTRACVCVCVCVCVARVYIVPGIHNARPTSTCMWESAHACENLHMRGRFRKCLPVPICVCMYIYIYIYMHTYTYIYIYIYICT